MNSRKFSLLIIRQRSEIQQSGKYETKLCSYSADEWQSINWFYKTMFIKNTDARWCWKWGLIQVVRVNQNSFVVDCKTKTVTLKIQTHKWWGNRRVVKSCSELLSWVTLLILYWFWTVLFSCVNRKSLFACRSMITFKLSQAEKCLSPMFECVTLTTSCPSLPYTPFSLLHHPLKHPPSLLDFYTPPSLILYLPGRESLHPSLLTLPPKLQDPLTHFPLSAPQTTPLLPLHKLQPFPLCIVSPWLLLSKQGDKVGREGRQRRKTGERGENVPSLFPG